MKNNKTVIKKISSIATRIIMSSTAFAALSIAVLNVNSTCQFWVHQPKLPEGAKKLRKF